MVRGQPVSDNQNARSSWLRLLGVVLAFVIFGPPIGGLVFLVSQSILELPMSKLGSMIFAAFVFVPFTYPIGFWAAAAAGFLMASAYSQFSRVSLTAALAIGTLVSLAFMAANGSDSIVLPVPAQTRMPAHWAVILLANVIPTVALWWVTRSWFGAATSSQGNA